LATKIAHELKQINNLGSRKRGGGGEKTKPLKSLVIPLSHFF